MSLTLEKKTVQQPLDSPKTATPKKSANKSIWTPLSILIRNMEILKVVFQFVFFFSPHFILPVALEYSI